MRVLIVTETFEPSIDGVVTRLTHLVDYLCEQGHQVRVVAPGLGVHVYPARGGSLVPVHGAKTFTARFYRSRPFSLPWFSARGLVDRVVREFQPDVIHAVQPILLAQTAVWAASAHRIPLVASYHTNLAAYLSRYPAWAWVAPVIAWATKRMHNRALVNVATSEAMKKVLEAQGIERVTTVRRGVDTEQFHPSKRSEKMRERLGGGAPTVLLYVGRLAAEKDLASLVPLVSRRSDVALAFVGDGPHRAHLENVFAGTRARFLGPMRGEELAEAFASADAFIFPSVTETLGLVIGEAMASGLPVVAARSGPTEEQVSHGRTGLLYGRTSVAEEEAGLDSAIRTLADSDTVGLLTSEARRRAESYSWSNASADFVAIYTSVVSRGSRFSRRDL